MKRCRIARPTPMHDHSRRFVWVRKTGRKTTRYRAVYVR